MTTRKTKRTTRRRQAPAATGSMVPAKYREQYAKHGGSSGDDLAVRLTEAIAAEDGSVDVTKLQALAEANDCWRPEYAKKNAGMQRMNVSNRMRALVRRGTKIVWPR